MATPDRQESPEIRRSEQAVQNWSFDEVYKVLSTVGLGEYAGALYRLQVDASGNLKTSASIDTTGLATSAKQDTIIGHVDGLETAVASTNTKLDTANSTLGTIDADTGSLASTVVGGQLQVDLAAVSTTLYVEQPTGSALQTTEANSAAIKTAVETIDNAISGNEMQVDVVGALPAGTNAIGKLAANSGVDIGDVDVTSSVTSSLDHGSNLDIDTTAEQITSTSFACKFGVTVKADITNTGIIYIGNSDVTAGSTAATDGFPLSAGETLTLEVNNPNLLYAIASANNQKIYWVAN